MMSENETTRPFSKSATIIVAGMHRSGTSLTASILYAGGVNMGERLVGKEIGNEKGHFEDHDIVDFHKEVLLTQGFEMNGLTLVSEIPVDEKLHRRAQDLINTRSEKLFWGWKDPRTTLFLDFWNSLLPDAYFVMIYRAPWEVIESLYRRGTDKLIWENPEIAAELWKHYNQKLLAFYENHAHHCLLINISRIVDDPSVLISGIYEKFGIQLSMPDIQIIDKGIFNVHASPREISEFLGTYYPDIIKLYATLEDKAQQFGRDLRDPIEKPEKSNFGKISNFWDWQLNVTKNLNSQHYAQLYFRENESDFNEINSFRLLAFRHTKLLKFRLDGPKKVTHFRFDPLNDFNLIRINRIQFFLSCESVNVNFEICSNAKIVENHDYFFDTNDSQIFIDLIAGNDFELDEVRIELEYLKYKNEAIVEALGLKDEIIKNTFQAFEQEIEEKHKLLDEIRELKEAIKDFHSQNLGILNPADVKITHPENYFNESEIIKSGLFDENYYLETNPNVKQSGLNPLMHYLTYGGFEGRNPSLGFDSAYYLENNKDVKFSGMNPLIHFIFHGKEEGRLVCRPTINEESDLPHPENYFEESEIAQSGLFDENYYLETNPDVKQSGLNPLIHYLAYGGFEGRNPSLGFDSSYYLENNKDVKYSGMNPLIHFVSHGKEEGRLAVKPTINEKVDLPLPPFGEESVDKIIHFKSAKNLFISDYQKFLHRNRLTSKMIDFLIDKQNGFTFLPFFSIIMPVYNPEVIYLEHAINSIISQIYPHWELVIIDDHSNAEIEKFLISFAENKKFNYKRLDANLGVSIASNEGIRMATGDYILFMDHDDLIEKDALVQIANFLQNNNSDILYTDDGTIEHDGMVNFPAFKPDWSPELALSFCYVRHIVVYKRQIILQTGNFNSELNGSQDYDYFLRATHFANRIDHLPIILYHWRSHNNQLHKNNGSMNAGLVAVQNYLNNSGIDWVEAALPEFAKKNRLGIYSLKQSKNFDDLVSIIIPVRNGYLLVKKCVDSIKKSSYRNFEIIIANDESEELQTVDYLKKIEKQGIKVLNVERLNNEFNYSRLNNKAVGMAKGDFLILLNADTEIISPDWIEQMLIYCKMPGVGIVGGKLFFHDQRIQHAGVIVTMDKKPAHHPFAGSFGNEYMNFDMCARNYSAVTAACLMISKSDFIRIGGFDEVNFNISSNDVDLCLRILESGKRIVYNPNALILHHEGGSRNRQGKPLLYLSDDLNLIRKYKNFTDSYYNPNQHNEVFFAPDFNKNNRLRYFEKKGSLLKMVFFTHNLNIEGAPKVMFKVAKYLNSIGDFHIEVLSQEDGPMRNWYDKEGIKVSLLDAFPSLTKENYSEFVQWLGSYLIKIDANLVYANTLDTFWAIDASYFAEIPSIWGIHESVDPIIYFRNHPVFSNLTPLISETILKSNRNLFVCKSTMKLFEKYNHFANMDFIYNGIDLKFDQFFDKDQLDKKLNLPTKTIITIVGTICQRKGQLDFVKAAKSLLKSNNNLHFMIIGKNFDDEYYQEVVDEMDDIEDIVILEDQENIMDYFNAADIYVCSSYNESFPLVILEAMLCSLPIVTTPVFGISEQLTDGETALFYNPGEIKALVSKIEYLLDHKQEAKEMGDRARLVVELLFREEDMLLKYEELFRTVVYEDVITQPLN